MQTNSSAQERLKTLLHDFKQVKGSEVLVIQDDLDITCGIVIHSQVQKLVFEQWGENLALDFTHGTNNLRFHLGSLVATGPTGRGIPVVDFLALNEKAVTMTVIFKFVKEKNPEAWHRVQTFVIDKHLAEWQVLERCFPDAKVLLCQFHALTYWKKILGRKFGLKPAERDIVQRCFANMLYSPTEEIYTYWYGELVSFAKDGHSSVHSESETDFEDDYLLELADILEADDEMWLDEPEPSSTLSPPATLTLPTATLSSPQATLTPLAQRISPARLATKDNVLTDSTTTSLHGPEWSVADLDSCPSAPQVSLDHLEVSELSQAIIEGNENDNNVSPPSSGDEATKLGN
ncbi:hypothetical protein PF005_g15279 [Phytophthora fragariae]|uniref:ZSWIM1/3 RNaseH-like domain-containing protein n=1 Tax=Phytophthora fragariae TaxID=53985 RepID=A0A6A3XFZ5_9STRA|nr:hypothetical protein PF005_g15279 [Phytophthora fragariae]KAE9301093.1 hypothetical protein PF001_g14609 [Phytophthora fragariae]